MTFGIQHVRMVYFCGIAKHIYIPKIVGSRYGFVGISSLSLANMIPTLQVFGESNMSRVYIVNII